MQFILMFCNEIENIIPNRLCGWNYFRPNELDIYLISLYETGFSIANEPLALLMLFKKPTIKMTVTPKIKDWYQLVVRSYLI